VSEGDEELGPLPAGRHGLSREQVAHSQRERLIAGLAEAVAEHGYADVTIGSITSAASVSRRTFYEHFDSKEECFLAAYDVVVEHLGDLMNRAIEPIADWPHKVVAGIRALLSFFEAEPDLARLCLVDSLTAGPAVAERFRSSVQAFVPLLRAGRQERPKARELPDSTEETIIGSVGSTITRAIMSGKGSELQPLLPDFAEFVLTPYLGADEARRVAEESR
jgi:AcrR family transcriptional regulator